MKITIESMKKEYDAGVSRHEERAKKIAKLENDIAEFQEKAKACALEDDLTGFKQIKQEIEYLEYQLEALKVKQKNEKTIILPFEKVQAAWQDYETHRAKTVCRLENELEAVRKKLFDTMAEIVDIQNEGLNTRNDCAKMIGMQLPSSPQDNSTINLISVKFPMRYFDLGYLDKGMYRIYDFEYLENLKLLNQDINQRMHRYNLFKAHYPGQVIMK